jgi:hypothetical protein
MSPAVQALINGISSGAVTPANANSAIRDAGGADFVVIQLVRQLAASTGGLVMTTTDDGSGRINLTLNGTPYGYLQRYEES